VATQMQLAWGRVSAHRGVQSVQSVQSVPRDAASVHPLSCSTAALQLFSCIQSGAVHPGGLAPADCAVHVVNTERTLVKLTTNSCTLHVSPMCFKSNPPPCCTLHVSTLRPYWHLTVLSPPPPPTHTHTPPLPQPAGGVGGPHCPMSR
jgi:hypothetical protein